MGGALPLSDRSAPNAAQWLALVTDDAKVTAECPVLRFRDTIWLQLLAALAWDTALTI